MAGTKIGGQKAAAKNLANDPDFYRNIGRKGGSNGHTGELARIAGKKGGSISRRKKSPVSDTRTVTTDEHQVIETVAAA
jgi:general stress protein YciG